MTGNLFTDFTALNGIFHRKIVTDRQYERLYGSETDKYIDGASPPVTDLKAIVEAHSDAVWQTAYRLLNNHEDAQDCYQETFLTAQRLSGKDEIHHWRAMLQQITTRRALDVLRRRYRREKTLGDPDRLSACRSEVDAPDARSRDEELRDQVRRALATLPAQQAEAFWLRHMEQLSPNEVAELMGIEPGHARVLVHRATVQLRKLLGTTYGPEPVSEETS